MNLTSNWREQNSFKEQEYFMYVTFSAIYCYPTFFPGMVHELTSLDLGKRVYMISIAYMISIVSVYFSQIHYRNVYKILDGITPALLINVPEQLNMKPYKHKVLNDYIQ